MTIWGLLLLAAIVMKLWPETSAAQWLHKHLVERPVKLVQGLERRHLILLVVLLMMTQAIAVIGSAELVTLTAIDISAYVDAAITAWTIAALSRSRGAWKATFAQLPKLRGTAARPRQRRTRPTTARKLANDDEAHRTFALAA